MEPALTLQSAESRWEMGSDFHWPFGNTRVHHPPMESHAANPQPWPWQKHPHGLWGSGRQALFALLKSGQMTRKWQRVWCPAYTCPEVVHTLRASEVAVEFYEDSPHRESLHWDGLRIRPGDVLLVSNLFGLRRHLEPPDHLSGVDCIEDHSHDLLALPALQSKAAFAFASLRKTLPLSDGGVVWSPRGFTVPGAPSCTAAWRELAARKLAAMVLKREYLLGLAVEKDCWRQLFLSAEEKFSTATSSGISPWSAASLELFPARSWRDIRRQNYQTLTEELAIPLQNQGIQIIPSQLQEVVPYGFILVCRTSKQREELRRALITTNIYPAVLWDLAAIPELESFPAAVDVANRMLMLHCDARYSTADIAEACLRIQRTFNARTQSA